MKDAVHIVCLDAPSPPNYGGAIDIFYKIAALASLGKKPIIHYFSYHRERNAAGLEKFGAEIYRYPRKNFFHSFSFSQPYIVRSRISNALLKRLNADDHPVILEGLHCTGMIHQIQNRGRVVVRLHNEEAAYYKRLAVSEKNWLRRVYFKQESFLLKKYYKHLPSDLSFACLSHTDAQDLKEHYGFGQTHFIPCFIPWQDIRSKPGRGEYCLYHGNMAISENEAAAIWLVQHVFSRLQLPLVIAGNSVSKKLKELCESFQHISIVSDPSIQQIDELIREAQIHVLPSLNNTGVKLKLLHALCEGRFCITNSNGERGSQLRDWLIIAEDAPSWISTIREVWEKDFPTEQIKNRQQLLTVYNNLENAKKLSAL